MKKSRVQNRKDDFIPRAKIGIKNADRQLVKSNDRNEFEAMPDGYFVWKRAKKNKT